MSGHTYTHTYIHSHTHTYTHDNYYNPRCAHAHRGLIIGEPERTSYVVHVPLTRYAQTSDRPVEVQRSI